MGPTFRALDPDGSGAVRLRNLVAFIDSIQRPVSASIGGGIDPDGAAIYRDYCWSCHGPGAVAMARSRSLSRWCRRT
jgi:mono/diheme cytochrome c family protein